MKKQLVLIFAVLLIIGFAASVYADVPVVASGDPQVTLSGEIRFRGRIDNDFSSGDGYAFDNDLKNTNTRARYDYKIRLGVLAKMSPKTKMFLQLSSTSSTSYSSHSYEAAKTAPGAAKGSYTNGNAMIYALGVRNAWIEHTIADMITVKAGHQPIKLGWGLFYDHSLYGDDAIVVTVKPTKELSVGALTAKLKENGYSANDADLYAGFLNIAPAKGTEISFDAAYLRDRDSAGLSSVLGSNLSGTNYRLSLWNFGARGKVKIGDLGLKLGGELQRGTSKDATGARTDIKFRGMAAMLGVSYDINPVTLDAELAYGSGDDNGTSDSKVKTFVVSRSANTPFSYVYEDTIINATNRESGGIANTMYAKLGAKANLTKDLKAEVRYYYLKAVKAPKSTVSAERYGFGTNTDKKDIGHEVDAYITYKLDKGLNYFVEGGYLFAGDFWKATMTGTSAGKSPDDPWSIKHGLEIEF